VGGRSSPHDHLADEEDSEDRLSLNDRNDELTISDVSRSDASTYSCRAFNSVGAATRTYTLVVQGSNGLSAVSTTAALSVAIDIETPIVLRERS